MAQSRSTPQRAVASGLGVFWSGAGCRVRSAVGLCWARKAAGSSDKCRRSLSAQRRLERNAGLLTRRGSRRSAKK